MTGHSSGAAGTNGIAVPRQHRRRCRSTSENIRVTTIPRPNSSVTFTNGITATSREMPWCGRTIRRRPCKERPRHRDQSGKHQRKESSGRSRMVNAPRRSHARQAHQSLRVRRRSSAKRLGVQLLSPRNDSKRRPPGNGSPGQGRYRMNRRQQGRIRRLRPRSRGEVAVKGRGKKEIATQVKGVGREETSKAEQA